VNADRLAAGGIVSASSRKLVVATVLGFVSLGVGCGSSDLPPLGEFERPNEEFSPVRYADRDLVSLNDHCPVSDSRLNPAIEPVYVNGHPIGFC
jgi:hypothetical protein